MAVDGATKGVKARATLERRSHAERRERAEREMLSAAVRLVSENGLAGLSLNDVGEDAGYSRGLPAHYFGRKDELVARLGDFIVEQFSRDMQREPDVSEWDGLEAVLGPADFYLKSVEKHPVETRALFMLMGEARNHPDLLSAVVDLTRRSIETYAARIKAGQDAGAICQTLNAKQEALLVLGQIRGVAALWLLDPDAQRMSKLRKGLRDSLKRSLAV